MFDQTEQLKHRDEAHEGPELRHGGEFGPVARVDRDSQCFCPYNEDTAVVRYHESQPEALRYQYTWVVALIGDFPWISHEWTP